MIKKRVYLLVVIFILAFPLFASQRLFDATSYEYRSVKLLCQQSGVIGPSSALPVTSDELLIALDRIDASSLSGYLLDRYNALCLSLSEEMGRFESSISIDFSPQIFLAMDYKKDRNEFFLPKRDERPLFDISLAVCFTDHIFMETALPIMNASSDSKIPFSSFDFLFPSSGVQIFRHMPNIARGSFGNDVFSFFIGRTRHSFGNGYGGNMVIGDNFSYQEVANLKFKSNYFSYTIDITHFDNQSDSSTSESASNGFWNAPFENANFDGRKTNRVVNRFDVNIYNKCRAVLNLGTLYCTSSSFDLRWIIPFMISHSYYNYSEDEELSYSDEANNILSLEIDAPIYPGFNLSFQLAMDQFELPHERGEVPNAFGTMLSLSYVNMQRDNDYEAYIEMAYTMPHMYMSIKKNPGGDTYNWNYDYYLGYATTLKDLRASKEGAFTGFPYGPNMISLSTGFNVDCHSLGLSSKTKLEYILQGDLKKSADLFYERDYYKEMLLGPFTHTVKINENIGYEINRALLLDFGAEARFIKSIEQRSTDLQCYFGLTWHIDVI